MIIQFPLLCPLSLTSKLNFNMSKTVYCTPLGPINVTNHTRDKQLNRTPASRSFDFVITHMITDRIRLHSVLSPLLFVL